jgi:hypothetical protein
MKFLFLILLILNGAFFAYTRGYIPLSSDSVDQAQRQPINADKIRVLSAAQVATMPKVKPVLKMSGCLEWGSFSLADAARAEQALQSLTLGDRLTQRRIDDTGSWWVYLPPQGSKASADKKLSELKRLGVGDYFTIQDEGRYHFAISLGVFSSKDGAQKRLEEVRAKGVRTALAGERQTAATKVVMQIRDGGDAAVARINELKAGYPGTDAKVCAAPAPDAKS